MTISLCACAGDEIAPASTMGGGTETILPTTTPFPTPVYPILPEADSEVLSWIAGKMDADQVIMTQSQIEQENQRMLVMFLCIILVFFSVAVGMIVSSVTRQLHNEGRTIGMLRAVGADEKAILGCYSGQLNAAILGGLSVAGAVYILFLIFSILDAIGNPWFRIRLADILQWAAVLGLTLAVAAACWALSRFILGLRIREILKKSIIDNIREL